MKQAAGKIYIQKSQLLLTSI